MGKEERFTTILQVERAKEREYFETKIEELEKRLEEQHKRSERDFEHWTQEEEQLADLQKQCQEQTFKSLNPEETQQIMKFVIAACAERFEKEKKELVAHLLESVGERLDQKQLRIIQLEKLLDEQSQFLKAKDE